MTYADLIRELFEKSGMQVKDYAAATGLSVTLISGIVNGGKGSLKVLDVCARQAGIDLQDYLVFPDTKNLARKHAVAVKHLIELLELTGSDVPEIARSAIAAWHRGFARGKPKPSGRAR